MPRYLVVPILAVLLAVTVSQAQFQNGNQASFLDLPTRSQAAAVSQRIGVSDITVTYHRPLINGRKV